MLISSTVFDRCFQDEKRRYEFQRESVATKVISLLITDAQASPIVIDGDWTEAQEKQSSALN